MNATLRKGIFSLLIIALVGGMTAMPAMASNTAINYDAGSAPQPVMTGEVTIADHPMGDSPLAYNNNNGEWTELSATVNDSADNPYSFVASDINFTDASAFPHASENSSLSSEYWATDVSGSAGSMTVSDVETAPGVDALSIETSSQTSGDVAVASFDLTQTDIDAPITADEEKRYLQIVGDVNTLDSDAVVSVQAVDEDGDYYEATINASADTASEDVIASATGEGVIYQQQLGEMTLNQVGDGTFNNIETVKVSVSDADAAIEISALNVDKMGAWDFGDTLVDNDDDDELETEQILENKDGGAIALSDLGTMGETFADAHIKGLTVPFEQHARHLDSDDVSTEFTPAEQYSNYESHFMGDFRFELPSAYDLSYSNLVLEDTVSLPGTRYVSVEYAEGTGDTAFDDISSLSAITGSYDSAGANVTVDDTVQPGTAMVLSYDYVVTADEQSALQAAGVMGPTGSSGGILDTLIGIPGVIIAAIGGVLGRIAGFW